MSNYREKLETELKATKKIEKLLEPLDAETRARIAAWVGETYGQPKKHG